MPQKTIIGICGRRGAGKSTLASFMPQAHLLPFAGPIKRALIAMGIPSPYLTDPALKNTPIPGLGRVTGRHLMVTLGTEWGRKLVSEDFWVHLWKTEVENSPYSFLLVDDVRMPNEVKAIRELGGILIAVKRPGEEDPPRWWEFWKKRPHVSESLRYEDFGIPVIINDGTPRELFEKFRDTYPG